MDVSGRVPLGRAERVVTFGWVLRCAQDDKREKEDMVC
jgi:hypothetical protein